MEGRGKNILNNQKGFTLIEIIAVLVILGILAAVAVPRYIDMASEAKIAATQGQVAEMKSSLNLAYAKYFIANGVAPTGAQAITAAGFTSGTAATVGAAPDIWNVKLTAVANAVTIDILDRNADTGYVGTGIWNVPQ